jgi:hypothetical protein
VRGRFQWSYLLADLHRVVGLLLGGRIELGVVLARATATAAIALEAAGLALLSLGLCGLLFSLFRLLSELSSFGDNAGLIGVLGGLLGGAFLLQPSEDILTSFSASVLTTGVFCSSAIAANCMWRLFQMLKKR